MRYKATAILQRRGELGLTVHEFDGPEIRHSGDARDVFEQARKTIEKRMVEIDSPICLAYQITAWKQNMFGGWTPMERPE